MSEINALIEKVKAAKGPDNELDIDIDIALFEPDRDFVSVRANAAKTKVVYAYRDGGTKTYWATDWTLDAATRSQAISRLSKAILGETK